MLTKLNTCKWPVTDRKTAHGTLIALSTAKYDPPLAVKKIFKDRTTFRRERDILTRLKVRSLPPLTPNCRKEASIPFDAMVPVILEESLVSLTLTFPYGGRTLAEFIKDPVSAADAADILFQLTWTLSLIAIRCNIKHRDLHFGNILVRTFPKSCIRTFSIFSTSESEPAFYDISYPSRLSITVIDWASTETNVPFGHSSTRGSRSHSRNAAGVSRVPHTFVPFSLLRVESAYDNLYKYTMFREPLKMLTRGIDSTMTPFLSPEIHAILGARVRRSSADFESLLRNPETRLNPSETEIYQHSYLSFSREDRIPKSDSASRKKNTRGRPRKWANDNERKRAYKKRRKTKVVILLS